jgi:NAD(P)-dependent dehydrogenase (short-subunit alcohol dehydrogenase family)
MKKIKNYLKRLFKYVLYDYKQPIIYAKVYEKSQNEIHIGKTYVITGGGSGLGYYIARSLLKSGARVVITGRNEDKLKKAVKELGKNCNYKVMDVKNISEIEIVMKEIFKEYKQVDALVNNAGISLHEENILEVSEKNFDDQFDTNLKGAYFASQMYIKLYKEYKMEEGHILFISSERGSMCDDIPYGLTKVAINSLTAGLSRRFYKDGIRVNAVAPGATCSDLTKYDKNGDLFSNNASGRILVQEEIAEITNYILSDYTKCMSGEVINCDSGNHLPSYF